MAAAGVEPQLGRRLELRAAEAARGGKFANDQVLRRVPGRVQSVVRMVVAVVDVVQFGRCCEQAGEGGKL